MSDVIGRITVPSIVPSGTFPLKTRFPYGIALKRPVVTHTFGSANAKIEQRFYLGTPAERYTFQDPQLARAGRSSLRNFWEARKGAEGAFTYAVPQPDQSFVNKTVYFENAPLTLQELSDAITSVGVTMCEIPDPASAPTYTLNVTVTRFPSNTLATALLDQVQEIIPLVRIRVQEVAVPDIFLSDRRVTVGTQLYLPRLLRIGEPGSEALLTQSIAIDGNVPSDDVQFTFGNADRVMVQIANDTNLRWARVELSLFHVGTGIKLDLWAGNAVDWHSDFGPEFTLRCSDVLSALTLSSPVGLISRNCWRRYGQDGCPAVPGSQVMDVAHFASSDNTKCDFGYNAPNGCMAHQVQTSYGGVFATPQGVVFLNKSDAGGGAVLRATSLINDTLFGEPLPEIWHNDDGTAQYGLPVRCKIAAGRDESDYYIALGLIGKGPLGALTTPQMWDQNGDGIPDTFVGSTLDGQPNHGYQVTSTGLLKPGANAAFGLRSGLGTDPAGAHDYFSLGRVAATLGIGAPRGWFTNPADGSPMDEVAYSGSAYNLVFAAGTAFLEIRRTDQPDIQPSLPGTHELIAMVSKGLDGYTWTAPGTRSSTAGCVDPFWVAINTYLRAMGQLSASAATQETYFDVQAAIDAAAISSGVVAKVFGTGTETQFRFKGTLDQVRPTRDWLQMILNNAAGYFTWSFGKLRVGCRVNASAVSAFTAGNMIFGSLSLEPVKPRFEKLTVKFQDQEYQFAANTVDYTDKDYAARYGRVQNPLSSDMELTGTPTKSQAGRLVTCRSREELGGAVASEQDAARVARFATTILALDTEAGQVVSIADADVPGGTGDFRILQWTLNRDLSIGISAKTVTPSMYDLTVGPKPTDVAAAPVPTESATEWDPNYETPVVGDPLFGAKGFGIQPSYQTSGSGAPLPAVSIFGDQPADRILQFKARRELVSGVFAQQAATVTTVDATHGTIAFGGSGLTVNAYVGRVISKLANPEGSTAFVPIQDFTVTANDASGNFTVTPDPAAAGCAAGDHFTLRTAPTAFDATSFTDAGFVNPYNAGLTVSGNRGNLALVIAGTGAGQSPQTVVDNTGTKVTVAPGWEVVPDATSVIVLVEAVPQASAQFDQAGGAGNSLLGSLALANYARMVVRIEGYTQKAAVLGRIEKAPFRELFVRGAQGTRPITSSVAMYSTDRHIKGDATGGNLTYTHLPFTEVPNQEFTIVKTDATAHTVTLQLQAGDAFDDGTTSVVLANEGDSFTWRVQG
jgi:hypothetical protein